MHEGLQLPFETCAVHVFACLFCVIAAIALDLVILECRTHKFQCCILGPLKRGSRLNPKFGSCFSDESFIGKVSRGTKKGHASRVALATIGRYLLKMEKFFRDFGDFLYS